MHPEDNRPTSNISVPPRQRAMPPSARIQNGQQQAAADVVRSQIDSIYSSDPYHTAPAVETHPTSLDKEAQTPQVAETANHVPTSQQPHIAVENAVQPGPGAVDMSTLPEKGDTNLQASYQTATVDNPYERTHTEQNLQTSAESWKKYHTAWQSYYQQYYERYYVGRLHEAKHVLEQQVKEAKQQPTPHEPDTVSTNEAMYDLRTKLRSTISTRATTVRKSRHFIPIVSGLVVMLIFLFLQYNRTVFAAVDAYITPSSLDPSTLIVDPSTTTAVSNDPKLIIPSIGVDVPIIWDADASSEDSLNAAMDKGVAWFNMSGASAKPGEKGNFVLSGHSANDWLDKGDYKFIFARLEQMKVGDPVYVNYNGTRYTYKITSTKVVKPTDVSALQIGTDKPYITLITCTPLGTALNRLLVFGEQVSPDPDSATTSTSSTSTSTTKMPANSPTFLERIFGTKS